MTTTTTTAITAGQAVRHRVRRDYVGRVHRVTGTLATVVLVRRRNKSVVRVDRLELITDAELALAFHLEEADPERLAETSAENRRFLLAESTVCLHAVCSACRIGDRIVPATHASRYGDGHSWCCDHARFDDPPLTTEQRALAGQPADRLEGLGY